MPLSLPHRALAITALCLLALVARPGAAHARADVHCGPPNGRRLALVLHAGGWLWPPSARDFTTCAWLGRRGYRATLVDYPLRNVGAAFAAVARLVQHDRAACPGCTIVAYGESAGGGMAAWLAATGAVDGAYAWAPVRDLEVWDHELATVGERGRFQAAGFEGADHRTLRRYSADQAVTPTAAPLAVRHGRADTVVSFAESLYLQARYPRGRLRLYATDSDHIDGREAPDVLVQAAAWLASVHHAPARHRSAGH